MSTTNTTPEAVEIGRNIRSARGAAGLTGNDVHSLTGIHPTCLSFFELGKREPSGEQIRRLARALKTTPTALYGSTLADLFRAPAHPRRRRNGSSLASG